MFLDQPIQPPNYNMFDCITPAVEHAQLVQPRTELLDYFVTTEYPRLDKQISNPFPFVYALFENSPFSYGYNQSTILDLGSQMFSSSKSLTGFEEEVLNSTFSRLLKSKPTRSNRM
jgi:hypothetical protein